MRTEISCSLVDGKDICLSALSSNSVRRERRRSPDGRFRISFILIGYEFLYFELRFRINSRLEPVGPLPAAALSHPLLSREAAGLTEYLAKVPAVEATRIVVNPPLSDATKMRGWSRVSPLRRSDDMI